MALQVKACLWDVLVQRGWHRPQGPQGRRLPPCSHSSVVRGPGTRQMGLATHSSWDLPEVTASRCQCLIGQSKVCGHAHPKAVGGAYRCPDRELAPGGNFGKCCICFLMTPKGRNVLLQDLNPACQGNTITQHENTRRCFSGFPHTQISTRFHVLDLHIYSYVFLAQCDIWGLSLFQFIPMSQKRQKAVK